MPRLDMLFGLPNWQASWQTCKPWTLCRPSSADRLDSAAAAVAVPLPSALPPDADAAPPPATPFYFVTLELVRPAELIPTKPATLSVAVWYGGGCRR